MYAIEFDTKAKGRTIEIPEEHLEFVSRNVKVILVTDEISMDAKKNQLTTDDVEVFLQPKFQLARFYVQQGCSK